MNISITPGPMQFEGLTPDGYHLWATQFYQSAKTVINAGSVHFSPVPYFLLCHAIELEIKSRLLKCGKESVRTLSKNPYGHDIIHAYEELGNSQKILNTGEKTELEKASELHKEGKSFEYFYLCNLVKGYSNFPDLASLSTIAGKLIGVT